ncbi:MAG TPA: M67 family metallopeptidase [Rhizomicrobium sp.]|nr:M67 family metallopeptidase [Rhizomicrobium sp.]
MLDLPPHLRAQFEAEARAAYPRECCGLIEGVAAGEVVRATALHPTRNMATQSDRFEVDPAEHLRLLRALRGTGHGIVGCYHSHPGGRAQLSARDRDCITDDGFLWLVLGAGDTLAAYACGPGGGNAISPIPLAPIV